MLEKIIEEIQFNVKQHCCSHYSKYKNDDSHSDKLFSYSITMCNGAVYNTVYELKLIDQKLLLYPAGHFPKINPLNYCYGSCGFKLIISDTYNSTWFCKCLQDITHCNKRLIDLIVCLLADCLLPYPHSKKLYIITLKDNEDIVKFKGFLRNIFFELRYGRQQYSVTVMEKYKTLNDICNDSAIDMMNFLKYCHLRAVFLERGTDSINENQINKLKMLIRHTDNNQQIKQTNNTQLIMFQTSGNKWKVPKAISDFVNEIDLSGWNLNDGIKRFEASDFIWTQLYFSLYGLGVLLHEQNSTYKFDIPSLEFSDDTKSAEDKEVINRKICDDFLNDCFVSAEEAEIRRNERKNHIKEIKKSAEYLAIENGSEQEEFITELMTKGDFPPSCSTYNDRMRKYFNEYLSIKHLTDCDIDIVKYLKKHYPQYENAEVNELYTGHKKAYAFKTLILKKHWFILKEELISNTDIPEVATEEIDYFSECNNEMLDFLKSLNKLVDFSPLINENLSDYNDFPHIIPY